MERPNVTKRQRKNCYRYVARLLRSGCKISELAQELGCSEETILRWAKQIDGANVTRTQSERERAEVLSLRCEIRRLQMERDLLLQAFARLAEEPVNACLPTERKQPEKSPTPAVPDDITVWVSGLT